MGVNKKIGIKLKNTLMADSHRDIKGQEATYLKTGDHYDGNAAYFIKQKTFEPDPITFRWRMYLLRKAEQAGIFNWRTSSRDCEPVNFLWVKPTAQFTKIYERLARATEKFVVGQKVVVRRCLFCDYRGLKAKVTEVLPWGVQVSWKRKNIKSNGGANLDHMFFFNQEVAHV